MTENMQRRRKNIKAPYEDPRKCYWCGARYVDVIALPLLKASARSLRTCTRCREKIKEAIK